MLFIFDAEHGRLSGMFLVKAKTKAKAEKKVEPHLKRWLNLSLEEFRSLIGNAESDRDDNARCFQVTFEEGVHPIFRTSFRTIE